MKRIGTWEPEAIYTSTLVGVSESADLNLHASAVFSVGECVRSFAIGIPASGEASEAPITGEIALYKVVGGEPDGAVRVWSSPVVIPEGHLGWFVQLVPYAELSGVADGDVLCAALSLTSSAGNSYRIHITSPIDNSIPEYASDSYAVSSGKTDPVWEHTTYSNYAPYFYVELEVPSGINETVPAAVDSITGEAVPPAGQRVEIAIDWARPVSGDQPGYNVLRSPDEGTVPLLSVDGEPTGITHRVVSGVVSPQSATAVSDFYDVPRGVWEGNWRTSNGGTTVLELDGFAPGQTVLFEELSGYTGGSNYRPTQVDINGVPIRLEPALTAGEPVDPVINVPVVADAEGKLTISFTKTDDGQFYGYLNFAVISYTTGAPSDDFVAEVAELIPAATDALQGSYADAASFAGAIAEALPAALDAGTGTFAAPEYAASVAEVLPAASDLLLVGYVLAPVAGDVAELVPAAVDAAQGSFALNAAGAVIAESVPAAVDALAGSVGVPVFAGAVAEVVPPAADQAAAQFAQHRFAAAVAEAIPAAQDALQAGHFIEPVSGFIAELLPAAVDAVAGFFVPIPDAHSGIAEQVPAAVDALSATAAVPQYAAAIAEVLPAATDAVQATSREIVYHPSVERTLFIEPERRDIFVEPESRVLLIAPERRTLTVGV